MSFDDIPEDQEESYSCPKCGGSVTKDTTGPYWQCADCDFKATREEK